MLEDLLLVRWILRARPCMGMVGLSPHKPKVQENYFHFGLVHRKHEYWFEHGGQPKARLQSFSLITSLKTTKVQTQQSEKAETVCSLIEQVPIHFAVEFKSFAVAFLCSISCLLFWSVKLRPWKKNQRVYLRAGRGLPLWKKQYKRCKSLLVISVKVTTHHCFSI